MCDGFEWYYLRRRAEQRAEKEKADELKKQSRTAVPPKSVEPERPVTEQEPVPA